MGIGPQQDQAVLEAPGYTAAISEVRVCLYVCVCVID